MKLMDRSNCLGHYERPKDNRWNQGDCIKCDGYDMTCKKYEGIVPSMVSSCKTKWNQGLENNLE